MWKLTLDYERGVFFLESFIWLSMDHSKDNFLNNYLIFKLKDFLFLNNYFYFVLSFLIIISHLFLIITSIL
jgi:hypothetical protein